MTGKFLIIPATKLDFIVEPLTRFGGFCVTASRTWGLRF